MESEKMKKENMKENKKVSKEIRLNVNFLCLIEKIKKEKLESVNKEKLESVYESEMGLVFNNCERVIKRVKRNMLKEVLESELKKRNLSNEEFNKISERLIRESKERKSNNYLSVKI